MIDDFCLMIDQHFYVFNWDLTFSLKKSSYSNEETGGAGNKKKCRGIFEAGGPFKP